MSEASESAHVRIVLADYGVDQQGKVTLVGAGISIFAVNPDSGLTAPFVVWAAVNFAPEFVGYSPTVELSLETDDGKPVCLPTAADEQSQERPVRIGTYNVLPRTSVQDFDIPSEVIRPKTQMLLLFQTGMKLDAGHLYRWRVEVDGATHDHWTEMMYIMPPAQS
jgi:hypothetical protein